MREPYSKGQWLVQRERLRLDQDTPSPAFKDGRSVASLLPDVLRKLGGEPAAWLQRLGTEWPAIVGADVARHCRPGRLEARTLTCFVDTPVWLSELKRYGQRQMLANIQQHLGAETVTALRLQPDPDARPRRERAV